MQRSRGEADMLRPAAHDTEGGTSVKITRAPQQMPAGSNDTGTYTSPWYVSAICNSLYGTRYLAQSQTPAHCCRDHLDQGTAKRLMQLLATDEAVAVLDRKAP